MWFSSSIILIKITGYIILVHSKSQIIYQCYGFLTLLFGFIFTRILLHFQLALITQAYVKQYNKTFLFTFIMIYVALFENYYNITPLINIDYVLFGLLILNFYGN